jgi:hypothetical protein
MSLRTQVYKLFSDPFDGSRAFSQTLQQNLNGSVRDALEKEMVERGRKSAFINSPTTSIALQEGERFVYSIVLNWFTGEIVLAYEKGVYMFPVKRGMTLDDVSKLPQVQYSSRRGANILCYNKPGDYQTNLDTFFSSFMLQNGFTTGPNRGCYLMTDFVGGHNIHVVGYNREKLTESAPLIAQAQYGNGLVGYELIPANGQSGFDIETMCNLDDPYNIRANLLFMHKDNADARALVEKMKKKCVVNELPRYRQETEGIRKWV